MVKELTALSELQMIFSPMVRNTPTETLPLTEYLRAPSDHSEILATILLSYLVKLRTIRPLRQVKDLETAPVGVAAAIV